ncbi:MAG TPA: biopolymer transporter ExbD [Dokdonella sp.]|nr:biopolymer transporter ExbD [Dokdonella sp.]
MSYASERPSSARAMSEINITPLVDVLLTVLIIFMITTPMLTARIVLPLRGGTDGKAAEPLVLGVSIRDTGEWLLEGQPTSRAALGQSLRIAAAKGLPLQLEIRPEAHASYDNLANVLAIAQGSGVRDLRVLGAARE